MSGLVSFDDLKSRGFAGTTGFGSSPALIVVDLTNAFTDPSHSLGSDLSAEIEEVNALTDAFRKAGHPVIYTSIEYETPEAARTSNWSSKIGAISELYKGSAAVSLDERLHRQSSDAVVTKQYASAFFGTDLKDILDRHNIDTVVLAGCSTSGCVRATAVDACQHGFKTIVCREAAADRAEGAHRQALTDIELKYGDVLDRQEIEQVIAQAGKP